MNWNSRRFWLVVWIITAAYAGVILVLTHLPPSTIPPMSPGGRVEHFLAYGGLAILLHLSMWPRKWSIPKMAIIVILTAMIFGGMDELTQPYFRRTCDIYDWYTDVATTIIMTILTSIAHLWLCPRSPAPVKMLPSQT